MTVNMGVASKVYWTTNEAVLGYNRVTELGRPVWLAYMMVLLVKSFKSPWVTKGGWQSTVDGCPVGWKLGWINGDVRINGLVISPTYKWGINWGEITH